MAEQIQALLDAAIRHQVRVERVKNSLVMDMTGSLQRAEGELVSLVKDIDKELVGDLTVREFNQLLADMKLAERPIVEDATKVLTSDLSDLAEVEAKVEVKSLSRLLGEVEPLDVGKAFNAAMKNPISATGELLDGFVKGVTPRQLQQTEALMRRAYTEGWTVQQAVRGLRGTRERGFKDGITALKTRQAEAVVRTSVQHVANSALQATWEANSDLIVGYEWVSTLDSKTTPKCQALDGKKFDLGKGPTPPIHVNCRSTTMPVLDPEFDFLDKGATRSAEFGPVDAKTTYYDWLKKQPRDYVERVLGKERAAILLDRGLTTDEFKALAFDKQFNPLTVKELKAKLEGGTLFDEELIGRPADGTKTGTLWKIADDFYASNGRAPTPKEFLDLTQKQGFNDATAKTQLAAWRKDTLGGGTVVKPSPTPTPTPTPKPSPVVTQRPGMPGSGATRKVWEVADELTAKLGREPTRAELLEATKALGINDSTAGTQFGKWKKAGTGGTGGTTTTPKVKVLTEAQRKEAAWKSMQAQFDALTNVDEKAIAAVTKEIDDFDIRYNERRLEWNKWRTFDNNYGEWKWRPDTPPGLREEAGRLTRERAALMTKRNSLMRPTATRDAVDKIISYPAAERTAPLKMTFNDKVGDLTKARVMTAMTDVERLVAPNILSAINDKGLQTLITDDGRAFFQGWNWSINLTNYTDASTAAHEITHAIEYVRPDISKKCKAFVKLRGAGEKKRKLSAITGSSHYKSYEVAYEDKWVERGGSAYSGKVYGHEATEVLTMGIQRLIADPLTFMQTDKEYFEFVVRIFHDL